MRTRNAFTLVEVMIALVVLGIATSAFASALATAQQVHTRTWMQARAFEQIQKVIEQIQNTNFASVQTTWNNTSFDVSGLTPQTGSTRVGSVTIFNATSSVIPVRIVASWTDYQGPTEIVVVYVHVNRGG